MSLSTDLDFAAPLEGALPAAFAESFFPMIEIRSSVRTETLRSLSGDLRGDPPLPMIGCAVHYSKVRKITDCPLTETLPGASSPKDSLWQTMAPEVFV